MSEQIPIEEKSAGKLVQKSILWWLSVASWVAIIVLIFAGGSSPGLLSLLLTIASITATWIVAHCYSKLDYESALRSARHDYAKNLAFFCSRAAEKVSNTSGIINDLKADLADEGISAEERIRSCTQHLRTLLSLNEMALNDWIGVIDDHLDQAQRVRELTDKAENSNQVQDLKLIIGEFNKIIERQNLQIIANSSRSLQFSNPFISAIPTSSQSSSESGLPISSSSSRSGTPIVSGESSESYIGGGSEVKFIEPDSSSRVSTDQ